MARKLMFLVAISTLTLASACQTSEVTYLECSGPDVVADVGAEDVTAPDTGAPADVSSDDTQTAQQVVGAPCGADDDCPTEFCVTTELLADTFGVELNVVGGLCSSLFCYTDEECGAEAACVTDGGFGLCVPACEGYTDCRYAHAYACAPAGDGNGCTPTDYLARAACGDGVCDESEKAVADQCPADCPEPPVAPLPAGAPCAAAGDCSTGFCLDTTFLSIALPNANATVPNGTCSSNPLAGGCASDEDCGEGGVCADGSALAGMAAGSLMLCLHACDTDADCRYVEGYTCFSTDDAGDIKGCLPANVISAIHCGDGECDLSERADDTLCPEDCE